MSNYHHQEIGRLEDFRQPRYMIYPLGHIKKPFIQGYKEESDSYKAPTRSRQTGPLVTAHDRYDNYGTTLPTTYPPVVKTQSKMDKCFKCCGKLLCCYCICDLLT